MLTARTVLLKVVTLGASVLFARRLDPGDFGALAIATSVAGLASFATDIGLGAALIRRAAAPTKDELRALLTIQIAVAATLSLVMYGIAGRFGVAGDLLALTAPSLLLSTVRVPAVVTLERAMAYRSVAAIDIAEQAAYYCWSIAGVLLGHGVYAIASAAPIRALVGTGVALAVSPGGRHLPTTRVSPIMRHLGFGLRFQGITAAIVGRDQGVNLVTAAVAGNGILGLWSFVLRLFTFPASLLESVYRVSYPLMAQVGREGADAAAVVKQMCRWIGIGSAILAGGVGGIATTLVPGFFGHKWDQALPGILLFSVAWVVLAPVSSAVVGALVVRGRTAVVSRAVLANAVVACTVIALTAARLGIVAVGLGVLLSSLFEALVLDNACRHEFGFSGLRMLGRPLTVYCATAGAGLLAAHVFAWLPGFDGLIAAGAAVAGGLVSIAMLYADEGRMALQLVSRRAMTQKEWLWARQTKT